LQGQTERPKIFWGGCKKNPERKIFFCYSLSSHRRVFNFFLVIPQGGGSSKGVQQGVEIFKGRGIKGKALRVKAIGVYFFKSFYKKGVGY
jgi:hypothetical protein